MSKKATEFQRKAMSKMYRGKEIFKPLNTGWVDEHVACVREWVANIFFYRKGDTTIMIDAGYNYDRLEEKMGWLEIDPKSIRHILIIHQDTDHVGAVEADSPGLFRDAKLYIGEIENRYLTGEVRRKVIYHLYRLPQVTMLVSFARIRCIFFLRCSFVKLSILTLLQFFTYRFCNIPKHYWRNSISQCSILRSFTSDQFKIIWKRLNSCDLSWSKTSISFTFH